MHLPRPRLHPSQPRLHPAFVLTHRGAALRRVARDGFSHSSSSSLSAISFA